MLTNGTNAMPCRAKLRHLLIINQRLLDLARKDRIGRSAFVISVIRICFVTRHSDFVIHVWYSCKLRT